MVAFLAWAAAAVPGLDFSARADEVAGCERQFIAHPEDPESARCFWRQADKLAAARRVQKLLIQFPQNPGLQMCSAVLGLVPPERAEPLLRSAADEYRHRRQAEGEVLARENLVVLLTFQRRLDEASREVAREADAALAASPLWRDRDVTLATVSRASLLFNRGDLEQAGLLLDTVPPGRLRDTRWLHMASTVHLFSGQFDRAWDDCLQLVAQPALSHFQRANGLYCKVQVLTVRADELPSPATSRLIEDAARTAQSEAQVGGNRNVEALASWPLVRLATEAAAARSESLRCLESAPDERTKRACNRAFVRWQVSSRRTYSGKLPRSIGGLDLGDPISRAEARGDQMRVAWRSRPFDDFVRQAQQALSEIERLRAQQPASRIQEQLLAAWSADYYWFAGRLFEAALAGRCPSCLDLAFGVVEKLRGRALHDILLAAKAGAPEAEADAERLPALHQAMDRVQKRLQDSSLPPRERESAESDLKVFLAEERQLRRYADLPGLATASVAAAGTLVTPIFATLSKVQQLLAPDEALLYFQIAPWQDWTGDFGGGSWLVATTRDARRCYPLRAMGRGDLRTAVAELFERRSRSHAYEATELYEQLLAPALAELAPGIKRLIIVPDDHLHFLPFATLRATPDGQPLASRYQISIVPSATLWARWRARPQPPAAESPALVLADPPLPTRAIRKTFEAQGIHLPNDALPAARRESDALVRFLGRGCERRVAGEVNEAVLLDPRLALERFALVHFAAHSIVDDRDPGRSGIWLSPSPGHDGLLRAAEIVKLRFDNRLVVLSTCSSNGGQFLRGEGVMSLAHAFFEAHARTVVASLWPQVDTDAEALLTAFYSHLGQGASVAAALRLAQLDLLSREPGLPAAAWAGMVVLGDGDLVPFPDGRHPWPPWWRLLAAALAVALLAAVAFQARRSGGGRPAP